MGRDVHIEPAERRCIVDGVPVQLRPKSFDLLLLLASRPGHLFPSAVLLDRIWGGRKVSPDVLTGCIRELRKALGDTARSPQWIQTVSGTGYRLLRCPGLRREASVHARDAPHGAMFPPADTHRHEDDASVAVLPFGSRASRHEAFGQALARDISVGLARTRWLEVAASASVEALVQQKDRQAIATALRVRYLVDGDLRLAGDDFALQVQLVDVASDRILWADRLSGRIGDIASLMEDVCDVTVSAVEREIQLQQQKRAMMAPVRGIAPWIGLHRGMNLLQRQDGSVLADAGVTLRAAARGDPACARIAAARSWHAWQELFFGLSSDRDATLGRARDHALESIDLDAQDPLGHWSLGRVQWLTGDLTSAAENLQRAVSLNPSFAIGHYSLGYTLYLIGRDADALSCCDRAIRLSPVDPLSFAFHCIKAHLLCFAGEDTQALGHARRIADHPNVHGFALAVATWVNELCGDRQAALECLQQIRLRFPGYSREDYMAALFHRSPWYPLERKRAIERAFDRIGF